MASLNSAGWVSLTAHSGWTRIRNGMPKSTGHRSADHLSSQHSDNYRVLDSGSAAIDNFARIHGDFQPSCNSVRYFPPPWSLTPCLQPNATADHSSRQKPTTRRAGAKNKNLKGLHASQPEQKRGSEFPPVAVSTVMPQIGGDTFPVSLSVSHSPNTMFVPSTPIDLPFPERLRLVGDETSTSSIFRMALICCVASQWIKIGAGLALWASRLRLRFFDSPLRYRDSRKALRLRKIGLFWDLENCPVPSGWDITAVVDKMRAIADSFGEIECFRAYGKLEHLARQAPPFLSKDVELCPVPDGKESADKAIIMDIGLFAFDHKSCPESTYSGVTSEAVNDVVVLVTGDRGFAPLLKELGKRNITTFVIGNAHQAVPSILCQSADFSLGWDEMMMLEDFDKGACGASGECICSAKSWSRASEPFDKICDCGLAGPQAQPRGGAVSEESTDIDCYQLDSAGSELLCTVVSSSSAQPNPLVDGLPKVVAASEPTKESSQCEALGSGKSAAPIGGKIRVLRYLRYEVAAIVERYYNKGMPIDLLEFTRLYELEMGHCLVPGHYGFTSVKTLLESMPDLVAVRQTSGCKMEIAPFFPKGRRSYGQINYSRDDLRAILYEILRRAWPEGLKKDNLNSEHVKITGRPLVLLAYEFFKGGDVFSSMRDIVHVDARAKVLHLADGAQEPARYGFLARNQWN